MKVNSASAQVQTSPQQAQSPAKDSKEAVQAKLREKFGKEFGNKTSESSKKGQEKDPDTVVSIDKKGRKEVSKEGFGDIKNNDPASKVTKEKLEGLLRTGGFDFSSKERSALNAILNK